jgi:hypothetical protein
MLKRLLSILLFGATLLPLIAPLLSTGAMAESMLPACCRRSGKHHCAMAMTTATSKAPQVSAPCDKCSYRQNSTGAVHLQVFTPGTASAQHAGALRQPPLAAQAECLWRISFDRSRQKRGPPVVLI